MGCESQARCIRDGRSLRGIQGTLSLRLMLLLGGANLPVTMRSEEQTTAALKTWLLAQIEQKRAAPASDIVEAASGEPARPPNESAA